MILLQCIATLEPRSLWPVLFVVALPGVIFSRLSALCVFYAILISALSKFKCWSSGVCVVNTLSATVTIVLMTPGFLCTCLLLSNPCLSKLLLLLAGDIELNPGPKANGVINVMFANVNSLTAESGHRFDDLSLRMRNELIDVACLSETGCNLNLESLNIDGYNRLDNSFYKSTCRGLLIYVKDTLVFRRRLDLETDSGMWGEIKTNKKGALLGLFYRSPSQSATERGQFFYELDQNISTALKVKSDAVIVGGDFNARSRHWWAEDSNSVEGKALYDISVKHSLFQFIHEPTRITVTSKSCLDLIFCNNLGFVNNTEVQPPISLSDHSTTMLSLELNSSSQTEYVKRNIWKFSLANSVNLNLAIEDFDWDSILDGDDCDVVCQLFTSRLLSFFDTFVPNYVRIVKPKDMPWFTVNIGRAINRRNRYYRKMAKNHSEHNVKLFKDSVNNVKNLVSRAKTSFNDRLCNSLNENSTSSKNYWHILRQLLGKRFDPGIPSMCVNNSILDNDIAKCKTFMDKLSSKFHHNYDESVSPEFHNQTDVIVENVLITKDMVRKALLTLDPSKQGGEDGLSNRMLKLVASSIDVPMSKMFNKFVQAGHFPSNWKLGIVVPIFKNKGSRVDPDNYRPVSLLNSISKVLND
jgi:hypothetical protein